MSRVVYRHLDAAGQVLYIGSTSNLMVRTGQHARTSAWFGSVAVVEATVEFPSDSDAYNHEAAQIMLLSPPNNIVHRTGELPAHLAHYADCLRGPQAKARRDEKVRLRRSTPLTGIRRIVIERDS